MLRLRLGRLLLLFAVFCNLPCLAQDAGSPTVVQDSTGALNLSTYLEELDRCSVAIKNKENIPRLRESLPFSWIVRVEDSKVEISTGWLRESLQKVEKNDGKANEILAEVQTRLDSLKSSARELIAESEKRDLPSSRAHLKAIFARPEFREAKGPNAFQLWMRHAVRWLAEKIVNALMRLHISRKNGNIFAWTVIAIAFVLLVVWIYRRLAKATVAAEIKPESKSLPSDTRQWIAEALAAGERGDFREAVHCGYWAAVASLEDHRLLERDRARTPRESLRLLNSYPTQQAMLGDLTRHFELIWYGYRPASPEDWSGTRKLLEKMGCLKPSTAATANS